MRQCKPLCLSLFWLTSSQSLRPEQTMKSSSLLTYPLQAQNVCTCSLAISPETCFWQKHIFARAFQTWTSKTNGDESFSVVVIIIHFTGQTPSPYFLLKQLFLLFEFAWLQFSALTTFSCLGNFFVHWDHHTSSHNHSLLICSADKLSRPNSSKSLANMYFSQTSKYLLRLFLWPLSVLLSFLKVWVSD